MEKQSSNRIKIPIVILLLFFASLLLLSSSLCAPQFLALFFHTSSAQISQSSIELGYGPASLVPESSGVPIFSYNDELWVMSPNGTSANLEYSQSGGLYTAASTYLQPNTPTELYTFPGPGVSNWTLYLQSGYESLAIPITYISPSSVQRVSGNSQVYFSNNALNVNFSYYGPRAYNAQVCLTSANDTTAQVPIPPGFGSGLVQISLPDNNNNSSSYIQKTAEAVAFGNIANSTVFSFETFYDYSYNQFNGTGIITSEVEAAQSSSAVISATRYVPLSINELVSPRPGRYTLRALFDNGKGNVSVSQTTILSESYGGGNWLWLGGCDSASQTGSNSFTSKISLPPAPGSEPRNLYLMYDTSGVEFYQNFTLDYSIARVNFNTLPLNAPLSNVGISLTQSSEKISSSFEFTNDTMYILATSFPVTVGFNLTFAGVTFTSYDVSIPSESSPSTITVPLSEITVNATNNGRPLSGANVYLEPVALDTGPGGREIVWPGVSASEPINTSSKKLISALTDNNGEAHFFVPAGNYSLLASYSSVNLTRSSILTFGGQNALVIFSFAISPVSNTPAPDYTSTLVAILLVGIAANALVWAFGIRRRRKFML